MNPLLSLHRLAFPADGLCSSFDRLKPDEYVLDGYRHRAFGRFAFVSGHVRPMEHTTFCQSQDLNSVHGDVARHFAPLDDIVEWPGFVTLLAAFAQLTRLGQPVVELGVHQIRITCSVDSMGEPAPEGIHQDGFDAIGIYLVKRTRVTGGETLLYEEKDGAPFFRRTLRTNELLVIDDRTFFHYTTPVRPSGEVGTRDVVILTARGLPVGGRAGAGEAATVVG